MTVTWLPFELHPEVPHEGRSLVDVFGPAAAPRLQMTLQHLQERTRELGLPLRPPTHLYNTRRALRLSEYAREQGRMEQLHSLLFGAYFAEGQNLDDDGVLAAAAVGAGLDLDAALAAAGREEYDERINQAMAQARSLGINSVPTFIINNRYKVVGAQPYEDLLAIVRKAAEV